MTPYEFCLGILLQCVNFLFNAFVSFWGVLGFGIVAFIILGYGLRIAYTSITNNSLLGIKNEAVNDDKKSSDSSKNTKSKGD